MIRQYQKIKNHYHDSILFFRLGDFYEMFFDDAKIASKILGITLTSRNKSESTPIPLCGVPFHSAEPYIAKLLNSGHKVAICEQMEDPKSAKGVVKRKVVQVLTPGAIVDSEKLESKINNYLAVVYGNGGEYGLAYADISTGEFRTTSFDNTVELKAVMTHIEPRELLINSAIEDEFPELLSHIKNIWNPLISSQDFYTWDYDAAKVLILDHYRKASLAPYGLEKRECSLISSAILLDYLKETQMDYMPLLGEPEYYETVDYLLVDESTKQNLELLKTLSGEKNGPTLLSVLDETETAMGGRLLKNWMNYPLINTDDINARLNAVDELKNKPDLRIKLRNELGGINDIEWLIGRISTPSAKPRDISGLRDSSGSISSLKKLLCEVGAEKLVSIVNNLDDLSDIRGHISSILVDDPPASARDGGLIREGFNEELDNLRKLRSGGKKWISDLEAEERKNTNISSLKVGFNKVFGYYIEVTKTNLKFVPDHYIRKQTLANAERFITPELKEYEEKITTAEESILEIEKSLFDDLRGFVSGESGRVRKASSLIAELDVLCSMAEIADENDYVMPDITDECIIELKDSRHPVVEMIEQSHTFVPNDINMDPGDNQFILITGPNMSGKSTLIRQVALTVLMAQMGSFVPASQARIGVADRIFTRVGASDNLARGLSTFMLEMVETAYILRNATPGSLIILDEIGRGTSTFDGMSIAWAVAEYLHDLGARTMFATHYHELANLPSLKERVKNFNVAVKRNGDEIVFLRKLLPGATSYSYGIEVAKLAGVPEKVTKSARRILKSLEKMKHMLSESITGEQIMLFETEQEDNSEGPDINNEIVEELTKIDIDNITPLQAISKLAELRERFGKGKTN